MQDVLRKLQCDVKRGGVELWWRMWHVQCLVWPLCDSDAEKDAMWCEMVVGGRPRCNAILDVEYGGPRWDVSCDIKCLRDVEHVVL